jgi:hypothetical protein
LVYREVSSNFSSCPSLAAAVPAFRLAETRHFRSASNYGRVHLLDPFVPAPAAPSVNNALHQTIRVKVRSRGPPPATFRPSCTVSGCRGADNRARVCARIWLVAFESTAHSTSGGARLVPLSLSLFGLQWMDQSRRADASASAKPRRVACVRALLHRGAPKGSDDPQAL